MLGFFGLDKSEKIKFESKSGLNNRNIKNIVSVFKIMIKKLTFTSVFSYQINFYQRISSALTLYFKPQISGLYTIYKFDESR